MPQLDQIEVEVEAIVPQRQSQVTEQTNNLEKRLSTLHVIIDSLAGRLSTILRSELSPKIKEAKESVELVILANTIQGFDDSVKLANYKIEDILERLDL